MRLCVCTCTRAIYMYMETSTFSVRFNFSLLHRNIRFSSFQMKTYAVYFSQNLRNKNSKNNLYASSLSRKQYYAEISEREMPMKVTDYRKIV